jgi:homoaconitase/3-isopropylmalate dehydratase large subunit
MHALSKIIARHAKRQSVEVGEIVNATPDFVMLNDRGAARAADLLRKMGSDKVFYPEQIVVVFDHHYPWYPAAGTRSLRSEHVSGSRNRASQNSIPAGDQAT